jgi:flagellum-specific ATP synthase
MYSINEEKFKDRIAYIEQSMPIEISGKISSMSGLTMEVIAFFPPIGAVCEIKTMMGRLILAQVIGFKEGVSILMPMEASLGIACGDNVRCVDIVDTVPIGMHLLGRVINGKGEPIDGKGPLLCATRRNTEATKLAPLDRPRIDTAIGTGVRAIDALMTIGKGQRMGIFSGPGVGKSTLLGTIAKHTSADVSVISLIGERGREVKEFIDKDLGPEGLARSVVIVSTSDETAPMRIKATFVASSIAEHFRDEGKDVVLLMDSITRFAMAQRQIGLALGEPPATKGYPPSVFSLLPHIVERCGKNIHGSITGFFTVLIEGDDLSEPVSDTMRGLLDGHISLSRSLANRGYYPAIDVSESLSRVMTDIVDDTHRQYAIDVKKLLAIYTDIEDLINIGAYSAGTNVEYDLAVRSHELISEFLQQSIDEGYKYEESILQLYQLTQLIKDMVVEIGKEN